MSGSFQDRQEPTAPFHAISIDETIYHSSDSPPIAGPSFKDPCSASSNKKPSPGPEPAWGKTSVLEANTPENESDEVEAKSEFVGREEFELLRSK